MCIPVMSVFSLIACSSGSINRAKSVRIKGQPLSTSSFKMNLFIFTSNTTIIIVLMNHVHDLFIPTDLPSVKQKQHKQLSEQSFVKIRN